MHMRLIALLILVSFGTVAAQTTDRPIDNRARLDKLRAEGYEALYNLDYEGARKRFREMIQLAPDNPSGSQCFASSLWVQQLNESWASWLDLIVAVTRSTFIAAPPFLAVQVVYLLL